MLGADPPTEEASARAAELRRTATRRWKGSATPTRSRPTATRTRSAGIPALLYNMGRALQALNALPRGARQARGVRGGGIARAQARVPRLATLIAEIRQRVSTVTISTNVDGARILVRGSVVGKSPLPGPVKLLAGKAEVEVDADGYFPHHEVVDLPGGGAITVDARMYSRSTTGVLSVRASSTGASVFVDQKRIGVAPVETIVAAGVHKILVRHPDHPDYETSASVIAGGRKDVSATLQAPSIVTRWWFWGGVGVVVATGAVVTAALLIERSPDSGTIPPGQLSAPNAHGAALFRF